MACNCSKTTFRRFVWIPEGGSRDGEGTIVYPSEIQAKAKVLRVGGTYVGVPAR